MNINQAVAAAEKWVQELHANPESGFCEYKTTAIIRRVCTELGVQIVDSGLETGVLAWLDNGCEETVALRADIDAVDFDSGPRHQCGHDHHAAALLGAMAYMKARQKELRYNVAFIFQPAEESIAGAAALMEKGMWARFPKHPNAVFGMHNRPELPCGVIGVHQGPLMAAKSDFRLVIRGQQGHGSTPEKCIDPILPAAEFTAELPSLVSHELSPFDPAVCSVYSFHSGTEANTSPLHATLTGSVRTLCRESHAQLKARLAELAEDTAKANRCQLESLEWCHEIPVLDNSASLYARARAAAAATVGEENITDVQPCLGGEDFAIFMEDIPGFYYWVGSGCGGDAPVHPWHSDGFSVAKGFLPVAVPLFVNLVM